jgi:autotransporter-associated beta strand protein
LNNFLLRSDDGGQTWTPIVNGINVDDLQNYFPYLAVDPSNGNHLLYSTDRVYESTDGGDSWTPISTLFANGWTQTGPLNLVAIAPSDPNTVYATINGHIFVTTNGGSTWAQHDSGNSPYGQILVDPNNAKVVYATGDGFGGAHLDRSIDGGITWENISGNLPDLPTYSVAVVGSTLFVGSDNGVWSSTDDGTTWTKYATGMPNTEVRELSYDPTHNILAAFTLGRGAWEISLAPTPPPLVVNTTSDETTPGDGLLSLREAIAAANSTGQAIGFDPSLNGSTIALDPANGPVTVSGSVSIVGPGSSPLLVTNSTSSSLEVQSGGTLRLSNLSFAGAGTGLQIDAGGQAVFQAVSASGGITDNGTLTFNEFVDNSSAANISGNGQLVKNGPARLLLNGMDSYLGGTTVRSGTLAGDANALGRAISMSPGAYLELDMPGTTEAFGGSVSGSGSVLLDGGAGSVIQMGTWGSSVNSTFTNSGPTTIATGITLIAAAANDLSRNSNFTINGNLDLGGFNQTIRNLTGAATGAIYNQSSQSNPLAILTVNATTTTTYLGVLENVAPSSSSAGTLSLVKTGAGTLVLGGAAANTYTAGTTISAGTIQGNSFTVQGTYTDNSVLLLDQALGAVTDGTATLNVTGTGSLSLLSGTFSLATGSVLANAGATTISGTLIAPPAANALSANSAYTVNGALYLNGFDQTVGSLSGTGTVYDGATTPATLITGQLNTSTTFYGTLVDHPAGSGSGALSVQKVGTGTFTLDGVGSYTGAATVAGGTLLAGPANGDPLTGPVYLQSADLNLLGMMTAPQQEVIAATGYNQDVIAEASATDPTLATTVPFDGTNTTASNNDFYENGFGNAAAQGTGLPAGDTPIVSATNPSVSFQLQPYNANNVSLMPSAGSTVTLQLLSPASFQSLNILAAGANGGGTVVVTLHFADGSTNTLTMIVPDWFNNPNAAYIAGGRIQRSSGATVQVLPNEARLYEFDFLLAPTDQFNILKSIQFTETSGNVAGIFAISGATWSQSPTQTYGNAIHNSGASMINFGFISPVVTIASLAENSDGTSLTVAGPSGSDLVFQSVSLQANVDFNEPASVSITLGPIDDNGRGFGISNTGSGTLLLTGPNTYGGATSANGGTIVVESAGAIPANTQLSVSGTGTVLLQPGTTPFMIQVGRLSFTSGGEIDIGNNGILVNYGLAAFDPIGNIQSLLAAGYNGGTWNGAPGSLGSIVSSSAANDPQHHTGIGYADWADGQGVNTTPNTIELKYTLYGDANLDGTVNSLDLQRLLFAFNTPGGWDQGDFNYDGNVNAVDLQQLLFNFNTSISGMAAASKSTAGKSVASSVTPTPAAPRSLTPTIQSAPASPHLAAVASRRPRKHR